MSDKSQKALKKLAAVILGIVFVVFAVLFFIGQVEDFVTDSGTSSGGAVSVVTSDVNSSPAESVQSAPNVSSTQSADVTSSKPENVSENAPVSSAQTAQAVSVPQSADVTSSAPEVSSLQNTETRTYKFRNKNLLDQHYEKHGKDMGFSSAEEYEKAASAVVNNPSALHKTEKEDGDDVYYIESTNEFVIVSTDGYIRTYFNPDRGIDYYNKQ